MWSVERLQVRDKESDNPWFRQFFASMGTGREGALAGQPSVWHPPTDVYETDYHVIVKIEVAGVTESDFAVRIHGRNLTVTGRRDDPAAKLAYHQMEISYGAFHSEVYLPCDVDATGAKANYENGFLYIVLLKAQQEYKVPVVVVIEHKA